MGTASELEILWTINFSMLKQVFGNKKNYDRYVAGVQWNLWNCWLIGLGWRMK